jgi:hypothetical protein
MGFLSTALAVSAAVKATTVALLDIDGGDSFWGNILRAALPGCSRR